MATLTWNGSYGFNLRNHDLSELTYAYSYTRTPNRFSANYNASGSYRDEFRGTGFTYDANGIPTGGVVKSYAAVVSGKKIAFIDGANVAVSTLAAAAETFSTADDLKVYKSILSGNDRITGGSYGDRLEGFNGNDILYGKAGADKLYGGLGADTFQFRSTKDSTVPSSGRDTIYDFSRSQGDKIDLRSIDAKTTVAGNQTFAFIGQNEFHNKAGELRYEKISGGSLIEGDVNGDGQADFAISLKSVSVITKSYFIL